MTELIKTAPAAFLWRAFFVFAFGFLTAAQLGAQSSKQYRPLPDYVQLGKPDPETGRKALEQFRSMGIAGDYYLEFVLEVIPRRGAVVRYNGKLWGGRREGSDWLRLVAKDAAGNEQRYLIQKSGDLSIWSWKAGEAAPSKAASTGVFAAILGTTITPFDLQMPYIWWSDYEYEGLAKLRGRPAYRFLMYPPAGATLGLPGLTGVRMSLDTQYGALVDSELLGDEGKVLKTLSLSELKSVKGQWIVKTVDVRDEEARVKTRLAFTAAALRCNFASILFEPATLADPVAPPAEADIERF